MVFTWFTAGRDNEEQLVKAKSNDQGRSAGSQEGLCCNCAFTLDLSKIERWATSSMKGKEKEPNENTLKKHLLSWWEKQKLVRTMTKAAKS